MNLNTEDPNGAEADDTKTKLIDLNYFNSSESILITELKVCRNDDGSKGDHLFRKDSDNSSESNTKRCFRQEGHAITELNFNHNFFKDIKDHESIWYCVMEERTEKDLFDIKDLSSSENSTALLKYVPPLLISEMKYNKEIVNQIDYQNDIEENVVLEFLIGSIKLNHHPLFSLEHGLESTLVNMYGEYDKLKNNESIAKLEMNIKSLRDKKEDLIKHTLDATNNNAKKIFKNQDLRKCVHDLKKKREQRIKALSEVRSFEKKILCLWKGIKYIRKKTGITNTNIVIKINKKRDDDGLRAKAWDENIENELIDVIDELKCEYYEKKTEFIQQLKKSTKSSRDKSVKPTLVYDENQLKQKLNETYSDAIIPPEDPILSFKITNSADILTKAPTDSIEINRRKMVNKTKLFLKVYVNNKMVCKTSQLQLKQDFTVDINEKFNVELREKLFIIKMSVFEKQTMKYIEYSDIIIPIPKENNKITELQVYTFQMNKKIISNKFGIGSGSTLIELLKSYSDFEMPREDKFVNTALFAGGNLEVSVKLVSGTSFNSTEIQSSDIVKKKSLTSQYLVDLFNTNFDPNDPENAIITTYFNTDHSKNICSENFYLNSDLYLKFNLEHIKGLNRLKENMLKKSLKPISKHDLAVPDNISNQIDFQRQKSIKYLQSLKTHLFTCKEEDVEKKISDILIDVKYPSFRSIALDILHPKKPLFYQSRKPSLASKNLGSMQKDYLLKICIFKAFHLPNRQDIDRQVLQEDTEEGFIKMANLRPFVSINCQGQTKRTTTVIGNNPTWNEEMTLPIKLNMGSVLTLQLYDEVVENWLADERLEDSTVHYHYNLHWLGSLKVPLINIFNQSKIDGTFLLYSPVELLGYKYEEKYPNSQISFENNLRKDMQSKQREEMFISMYMELFPNYSEIIPASLGNFTNSNEIDSVLQHLINFSENYKNQYPERKSYLLVMDSNGKHICFTRFFQPVPLIEFNECVKKLFAGPKDTAPSSRSSTPFKKKSSSSLEKDIDPNNGQTMLSTNLSDKRRQSKSIKDIFDAKSINENLFDDHDFPLAVKIQICTRYVSMIPTYKTQFTPNSFIVLSANQVLKLACGSMIDHTILLIGYFIQMGIECWCVAGIGVPYGFSTYVLIREDATTNDIVSLKQNAKVERKSLFTYKKNFNYYIYDASSGTKYNIKNPFSPLQRVFFVCNNENIWVNVQTDDRSNLVRLDFNRSSDWRPVFQKGNIISCPQPLDLGFEGKTIYYYKDENAKQLRDILQDKIKMKVQKWRGHRKTIWNRYCSKILKDVIIHWEKWSLNTSSAKPRYNSQIQQLLLSYQIYGYPLNVPYTSVDDIVSLIKGTQLHMVENSNVEFGLGVEIFTYPNYVYSVWVFFASITKK